MGQINNLPEALRSLATEDKMGITFIPSSSEEEFISYSRLYREAYALLHTLQDAGLKPGQELVIRVEDNKDFIFLFWACLLGKIIPVPLSMGSQKEQRLKLFGIWENLSDPYLVCGKGQVGKAPDFLEDEAGKELYARIAERTLFTEDVLSQKVLPCGKSSKCLDCLKCGNSPVLPDIASGDIAYIQYSSGSTGEPKGVVLTHSNLLHNTADIRERSAITPDDSLLSWMPLTHDMGLICFHLTAIRSGASQYILPTSLFIRRPMLWLQKADQHRATILYSPNFGYHYFLTALRRSPAPSWDLSCIRLIYNGAEPIAADLCREFISTLSGWRMAPHTICPGYGLAEASVAVTLPCPGYPVITHYLDRSSLQEGRPVRFLSPEDKDGIPFVETGFPVRTCQLTITDTAGNLLAEDYLGHIRIKGDNVTRGYYNNPVATAAVLSADQWLKTGDLGFLHKGNLVVTGREKNIIIINGQNYYPQDIEQAALEVEGVSQGMIAACGCRSRDQSKEELLIFLLTKSASFANNQLAGRIRESISLLTGLAVDKVIAVRQIPKTTSGKVQYFKLLEQYEKGGCEVIAAPEAASGPSIESAHSLLPVFWQVLGSPIPADADLFAWGINSMQASRLALSLQESFGFSVSIHDIFQYPSPEKLYAFLDSRREQGMTDVATLQPVIAIAPAQVPEKSCYEASKAQERFWVMQQYAQEPGSLHIGLAYTISGNLDLSFLQIAFDKLLLRHESLRSNFILKDDPALGSRLYMVLRDFKEKYSPIAYHDLSADHGLFSENDGPGQARQIADQAVNSSFDLSRDPLIRLTCLRMDEDTHLLVLVFHHIITDGWSAGIILRELSFFYRQCLSNDPAVLPPLTLQYKDYMGLPGSRAGELADSRAYWHKELAGELPVTTLPSVRPRPSHRSFRGSSLRVSLNADLSHALYEFSRQQNTTLFPVLSALLHSLFFKYTGQHESVIGTSIHGRNIKGADRQIGYFLNTVLLRLYSKDPTFREVVDESKQKFFKALEHQSYPFEWLREELGWNKHGGNPSGGNSSGFDVLLLLQNFGETDTLVDLGPALPVVEYPVDLKGSLADLQFEFFERQNRQLDLCLRYDTDLYEEWQIRQLAGHFQELLKNALADPDRRLTDLTILSPAEQCQLTEQPRIQASGRLVKNIPDLIREQALLRPDKLAVTGDARSLSYASLDSLSDELAIYLYGHGGVRPEDKVGLMLQRSEHMIVAMLAILKCGAAYLPVDPGYPSERIRYMMEDSHITLLYTDLASWAEHTWPEKGFPIHFREAFDEYQAADADKSKAAAGDLAAADAATEDRLSATEDRLFCLPEVIAETSLAYVLYTSGTTGRPKGVMIQHRSLAQYVKTFSEYFALSPDDLVIQQSSLSFDTSVEEIYPALCAGATVIVLREEGRDIGRLTDALEKYGATVLSTTPLVINELNRQPAALSGLRCLISGGDALKPSYIDNIIGRLPVYNTYGPTETTVCASFQLVDSLKDLNRIGRPLAHSRLYILNELLELAPAGIPGEICIGGDGLAKGYINDKELTAARFITHPVLGRLYRTGDLGLSEPDGTLVFCGRKDEQVKIRGYRVEPAEVAICLARHDRIDDAVVICLANDDRQNALIAYYTAARPLDGQALWDFLTGELPLYMIPSRFIHLTALPRTLSGKIDRKLLPVPDSRPAYPSSTASAKPTGRIEIALQHIWESVLGILGIGVGDNFFGLGGQSIKAVQILNKIETELQVRLPIGDLFREPTIARLAECIKRQERTTQSTIDPLPPAEYYTLSNAQRRLWVLSQIGDQGEAYYLSMHFGLNGPLNASALAMAFRAVIGRHESLRTVFIVRDGEPCQKIVSIEEVNFDLELTDLTGFSDMTHGSKKLDRLLQEKSLAPFDLEKGPLLRADLFRLSPEKNIFSFTIHHLIADAQSLESLAGELSDFYNNFISGNPASPDPLPVQYKDYAAWQQTRMRQPDFAVHGRFWKDIFRDGVPVLDLPSEFQRPPVQGYKGGAVYSSIDPILRTELEQIGQRSGASLFMVLLSAFQALIYRYTGQKELVTGIPVSGREHTLLEGSIGLYINTLALRTNCQGDQPFEKNLGRTRDALLDAFEHKAYPFDQLVNELNLPRDLSRSPLFDIMVGYRDSKTEDAGLIALDGITAAKIFTESVTSQFDLSVDFIAAEGKLDIRIEYNSGLFTGRWARRFLEHFKGMLAALLTDPLAAAVTPIDELNYLCDEETGRLLAFNPPATPFPQLPLPVLFEAAVQRYSGNIALVYKDRVLTYDQLNRRVNRLARYLREDRKVGPGTLIAILTGRSENMVIFLLSVWKAGGAYLPLDEHYPPERIGYILRDSRAGILLSDKDNAEEVAPHGIDIIRYQDLENILANYQDTDLPCLNTSGDLAYVIYTSGSTGSPKGVMIEQGSLVSIAEGWRIKYELGHFPLNLLQTAGFSFDVFTGDICRALLNGGKLVICPMEARADAHLFYTLLQDQKISIFESTPVQVLSVFKYIREHELDCPYLRLLIIGSDILSLSDYDQLVSDFGENRKILNSYGLTEVTIDSSFYEGRPGTLKGITSVTPIGKPLPNTRFYVFDSHRRLVPAGVPGELYIGGAGVARGYLYQPELNASRFLADPFVPGSRLFRTGDKASWLPDGQLLFHGRQDQQIKLRGYRIEPAEIKEALLKIAGISNAWVMPYKDEKGIDHLVAYICGQDLPAPSLIRSWLSEWLPAQMIPSLFQPLEEIPLSPNGKIDLKALPAPDISYKSAGYEQADPENPMEIRLQHIWQEVLEKEKIGVGEDFFQLGGHSLKAIKLLYRIERSLQIRTDLQTVFTHPTIRSLAARLLTLSPVLPDEKLASLPEAGYYEVSGQQQSLWILEHSGKGLQAAYNMPGAYRFSGPLQIDAFRSTIQTLICRHESLRTRFLLVRGELKMTVTECPTQPPADLYIDLRNFPDQEASIAAQKEAVLMAGFDLEKDSPVRFRLLQTGQDQYLFFFAIHHILSDGWSLDILVNELVTLYNALSKQAPNPLPDLLFQQKDIIAWNNKRGAAGLWQQNRLFWLKELAGDLPVLEMPADYLRPREKSYKGAHLAYHLGKELSAGLKKLSERQDVSLYMTLLAITHTLIFKYTGQPDIITGTTMAGRPSENFYDQIGYYVNTLPFRTRLSPDEPFSALLYTVKDTLARISDHQFYSLDKLVGDLRIAYDPGRTPLFEVTTVFQQTDLKGKQVEELDGITISPYPAGLPYTKFDLSFLFSAAEEGITIDLEYNTDLFLADRIQRLLRHFEAIARSVVASPLQKLNKLVYLPGSELATLLSVFNRTERAFPSKDTIIGLFEQQVRKTPSAAAVIEAGKVLSYEQLNDRANQLARWLQSEYNVARGDRVGIHLIPGVDLLVAIYGTLKAGAAYVPIDPSYPKERKQYLLGDSGARLLIAAADRTIASGIACLDPGSPAIAEMEKKNLPLQSGPEDLIYVIYTSGTTGKPKGVMIEHHSVVNLSCWLGDLIYLQQAGPLRALLTASISFDASVQQLFAPLLFGSCLVTVTDEIKKDPALFIGTIRTYDIDVLDITPSYLKVLLSFLKERDLQVAPGYTLVGGEAITADITTAYHRSFGGASRLINVYGVTEATVNSTFAILDPAADLHNIGKPLPNTRLYILDANLNLLPVGVQGQLFIAGQGVAKGYINNHALTHTRFIDNPFADNSRLYHTGDIARWTPAGTIEWLGRADDQVKIRGHRIEPEEITATALAYEGINEAATVVRKTDGVENELILYYTGPAGSPVAAIRQFLAGRLPSYMIPGYFVQLPSFPRTGSGKLDIRSLPSPADGGGIGAREYRQPATIVEQQLSLLWQALLQLDRVGLDDNFFERGGHSLKAIQLLGLIYREMNIELSLKNLFLHPTLSEMAGLIRDRDKTCYEEILPSARPDLYPASPSQQRFWILSQLNNERIAYNIVSAFTLEGDLDKTAFALSLVRLVQRHETLRTFFRMEGGTLCQHVKENLAQDSFFFFADWQALTAEEANCQWQALVSAEIQYLFDPGTGPLIRCRLLRLDAQRYRVVFNIHHIISDGWSTQVIIRDLLSFYNHIAHRQELLLPALSIQYKEYALWQQRQIKEDRLSAHQHYWKEVFRTRPALLSFDLDFPRPAIKTFTGAVCRTELPAQEHASLLRLASEKNVTLFMLLVAAVKTLLYRHTGCTDISIGSPVAGRDAAGLADQVGCYVNTIVLRSEMRGEESFDDFLQRLRNTILDAYEHQAYPFDRLVDELGLPRDLSRSPLFDVMITLENKQDSGPGLSGMQRMDIRELELTDTFCQFDFGFNFAERDHRLFLSVEYNKDLFMPARMETLAGHVILLLRSLLQDSSRSLKDLEYISAPEKDKLLREFNNTQKPFDEARTLQERLEEQAVAIPALLALQYRNITYTYSRLNEEANRLAHYLMINAGVRAGDSVGLLMEKSHLTVVGIWGIIKAGAAYVPIDPAYPDERKKFLLRDSGVRVLLVWGKAGLAMLRDMPANELPEGGVLDIGRLDAMDLPSFNPPLSVTPAHPAYMIYTSGTTGHPKGVLIRQDSVSNLSQWISDLVYGNFDRPLRTMLTASFSFDSSVKQLFPPFLYGGCLVILPEDKKLDLDGFIEELDRYDIDLVDCTPTYLDLLLSVLENNPPVRAPSYFIVGGEELTTDTVTKFYRIFGTLSRLINVYGVTEATVDSTCELVPATGRPRGCIGTPISNTQIYILDGYLQLLPAGVAGEICIAGRGVASGYWRRPELTSQKFCNNPFKKDGILYRTGDRGRWLPDGSIEYQGRIDQQVKIAGHRIEPGEIEQTLAGYPGLEKSLVLARRDEQGENSLVAFYTGPSEILPLNLRHYLSGRLPAYMMPSGFIRLDFFPVTAHGKLDIEWLQRLPLSDIEAHGPAERPSSADSMGQASTDPTVQTLEQIWMELLGKSRIGIHENFFETGGNSLKVIRLYHAIREAWPITLNVHQLFSYATISGQAGLINGLLSDAHIEEPRAMEFREIEF